MNWKIYDITAPSLPPWGVGYDIGDGQYEITAYCFTLEKADLILKALIEISTKEEL